MKIFSLLFHPDIAPIHKTSKIHKWTVLRTILQESLPKWQEWVATENIHTPPWVKCINTPPPPCKNHNFLRPSVWKVGPCLDIYFNSSMHKYLFHNSLICQLSVAICTCFLVLFNLFVCCNQWLYNVKAFIESTYQC